MDTKKLQKVLVESANNKIETILKNYCYKKYNSLDYFNLIKENLRLGVIEIPNPQIWVEDEYITNSTNFSLMNIAKEPRTFCQQPVNYDIPVDEPNFGENRMGATRSLIFYERYLAECENIIRLIESFYPTHTIEVPDFGFALCTLWIKTTFSLMKKVKPHYKKFFTHRMINQFITSLAYNASDETPNIKFVTYDAFGLMSQGVEWKYQEFKNRFNNDASFITLCTHDVYQDFMNDFLAPLRSLKSIRKGFLLPNIEFREVEKLDNNTYKLLQGLLSGQMDSMNPILHSAFNMLVNGESINKVLKILKDKIPPETYKRIKTHISNNADRTDLIYKYNFLEKNIKAMENKGVTFAKYDKNIPLLPPTDIFSEVILNMDKFKEQYPSQSEQQFIEVYLMAQTINACRRTFVKKYLRKNWNLCVKMNGNAIPFLNTLQEVNEKLISEELDNFIALIQER